MVSASYEDSTGRAVKSLPPITPSERGRCSLSEINHSSKLLPGSAAASTLRTVKFLVAPSTVRMNAGEPPSFCSTATYCAGAGAGGAGTCTTWVRGVGRMLSGSRSGRTTWVTTIAIKAAAIAVMAVAILRQRRTGAGNATTLLGSVTGVASTTAGSTGGGGASGRTSGICAPDNPAAALILSQTSGDGSTEPTIWFRAPSLVDHASTIAAKSLSTDIMASACARSSASRVPSAYSAVSAICASL